MFPRTEPVKGIRTATGSCAHSLSVTCRASLSINSGRKGLTAPQIHPTLKSDSKVLFCKHGWQWNSRKRREAKGSPRALHAALLLPPKIEEEARDILACI